MAWISVHTGIDGPKLREFRKLLDCSKFEAVGMLVFFWFWCLENAEKDGYIPHADKTDLQESLVAGAIGAKVPVDKIVDALIETDWIDEIPGGFRVHDWEIWQKQWYKAKEQREYDVQRKRESRSSAHTSRTAALPEGESVVSHESPEVSPVEEKSDEGAAPKKTRNQYPKEFEEFWKAYPRQIGKGDAYKKYQARRKDGFSEEELLTAAKNYATQCIKQKTDAQYIKHPKTFLSENTPFTDFIPKETVPLAEQLEETGNPFEAWGGMS